jgi:hypothetical protein
MRDIHHESRANDLDRGCGKCGCKGRRCGWGRQSVDGVCAPHSAAGSRSIQAFRDDAARGEEQVHCRPPTTDLAYHKDHGTVPGAVLTCLVSDSEAMRLR